MLENVDEFEVSDLGDAAQETKQVSPIIPFYADSTYGFGIRPNG